MKLNEILSKPINNVKSVNKPITDVWPKQEIAGVGAQAIAYLHKKYPDKIVKTIQVSGTTGPSYQFIRLALNHQDNPYFPKIFSIKYYQSSPANSSMSDTRYKTFDYEYDDTPPDRLDNTIIIVTEKLSPIRDITEQDLKVFGIDNIPIDTSNYNNPFAVKFRFAFTEPSYRKLMINHTTNKYLKQALKLLEPLFANYPPDMHKGNIMQRDNNQWVFIDPITNHFLENTSLPSQKINELTGYKSNPVFQHANQTFQPNPANDVTTRKDQLKQWHHYMTQNGFTKLGSGSFAGVYEHPNYPWIFKVFNNDPAYLYYLKYAKNNQQNPAVPKIKGNIIKINDNTFAIRTEKLSPAPPELIHDVNNLAYYIAQVFANNPANITKDAIQQIKSAKKPYPNIYKVLNDLATSTSFTFDIYGDNIMMRGNIPVLTDPIFNY